MRRLGTLLLLTAVLCCAGPIVSLSGPGTTSTNNNWSLGFQFTATSSLTIIALGAYDFQQDGFDQPQLAALWADDGTLLAWTYVDSADPLAGYFRFHSITPVTLIVGDSYVVSSQGGEGYTRFPPWVTDPPTGVTFDPGITFVENRWGDWLETDTSPVFPGQTDPWRDAGYAYFGGNARVGAVPEPVSLVLTGAGLAVLLCRKRRKLQATPGS
jgi:hypothetical protein